MARVSVSMSPDEVAAFLDAQTTMTVATVGTDGRPHLVAMWFVMLDGCPVFWTSRKSQKAVNLLRDPRITCLVEAGEAYHELRGVEIKGDARIIDRFDDVLSVGMALSARYGDRMPATPEALAAQAHRRVAVAIPPLSIVSWDHRKLLDAQSGPESGRTA